MVEQRIAVVAPRIPIPVPIAIAIAVAYHQQQRGKDVPANHCQDRHAIAEGMAPVALENRQAQSRCSSTADGSVPIAAQAIEIVLRHAGIEPELHKWPPR